MRPRSELATCPGTAGPAGSAIAARSSRVRNAAQSATVSSACDCSESRLVGRIGVADPAAEADQISPSRISQRTPAQSGQANPEGVPGRRPSLDRARGRTRRSRPPAPCPRASGRTPSPIPRHPGPVGSSRVGDRPRPARRGRPGRHVDGAAGHAGEQRVAGVLDHGDPAPLLDRQDARRPRRPAPPRGPPPTTRGTVPARRGPEERVDRGADPVLARASREPDHAPDGPAGDSPAARRRSGPGGSARRPRADGWPAAARSWRGSGAGRWSRASGRCSGDEDRGRQVGREARAGQAPSASRRLAGRRPDGDDVVPLHRMLILIAGLVACPPRVVGGLTLSTIGGRASQDVPFESRSMRACTSNPEPGHPAIRGERGGFSAFEMSGFYSNLG